MKTLNTSHGLTTTPTTSTAPGRSCPLRYRYGAAAMASAPLRTAQTLYLIGGLYGNLAALDQVEALALAEFDATGQAPTLCFNGDFNWFNTADSHFAQLNQRVLQHHAIQGNVEAELYSPQDDAGCGCAYPDSVGAAVVQWSNLIHAQLKATARRHPALLARLAQLPMLARYQVAGCRVGVVHGDADALAGWGFDVQALDNPQAQPWLQAVFAAADVQVFASSHTCLPALRQIALTNHRSGLVANNGAAGMPNFAGDLAGLVTRIGNTPSAHPVLQECQVGSAFVALLPLRFDVARWQADFLAQWPPGSAAWLSYFERISQGPAYQPDQARLR